ncbi:Uncharacterised protein [Mycobacteroides abscessus subsp. massiliense]|nr:Uncharacterised protein [Mycobacteroides abscessus subsp. abscessus]SKV01764.1 Uncharacterised protein [Mycobacteroides abscessus subsp. massiliense]SKV96389.1 Uncharacterised protein [Mycobacteroides abscessus subsp. abscessus]SKW36209.1 Uncharacterised protein [Mycobacteroides abscessus subsp. abscessus]
MYSFSPPLTLGSTAVSILVGPTAITFLDPMPHCAYLPRTIVAAGSPTVLGFKLICQPKDSSARENARHERQPDSA